MGIQDPLSSIVARCDESGCSEVMSAVPASPVSTTAALISLFTSVGWLMTPSKKTYCPKHSKGKK